MSHCPSRGRSLSPPSARSRQAFGSPLWLPVARSTSPGPVASFSRFSSPYKKGLLTRICGCAPRACHTRSRCLGATCVGAVGRETALVSAVGRGGGGGLGEEVGGGRRKGPSPKKTPRLRNAQ